jgi:hypothetical protein
MEFQSAGAQLKPVKYCIQAPASSYVTFNNKGWRSFIYMVITNTDEQGKHSLSDLILKMKFVFLEKNNFRKSSRRDFKVK